MKFTGLCIAALLLAGPAVAGDDKLEDTYQLLKTAVDSKDAAQVKKLALELYPMTSEAISSAAPTDPDEKTSWQSHVTYIKGVQSYAEYALYAIACQSAPEAQLELIGTIEKLNPKSKYMDQAYGIYMVALTKTGKSAEVLPMAEKALTIFPENEDLLLVLADNAVSKKQTDRALTYANRLTAALAKRPKPESYTAADWERKKGSALGRGYWIAGVIYAERSQYGLADKNLRAALPYLKGSDAMLAPAYFYLGMANYQLGQMTRNKALLVDAVKFSQDSAMIQSPYAEQARHNALVMKADADKMR